MEQLTVNKKLKFPFPIAAIFLIIFSFLDLLPRIINTFNSLFNDLVRDLPDSFEEWIDVLFKWNFNFSFFVNVILAAAMLALSIMLLIRKPNVGMTVALGIIAVIYIYYSFVNLFNFAGIVSSYFYIHNIFEFFEHFFDIIIFIFENLFNILINSLCYFITNLLYALAFILLIPISVNAYLKKGSRLLSAIWFVPGVLAIVSFLIYVVVSIFNIFNTYGPFAIVIEVFIQAFLLIGVFPIGLWFSQVSRLRREAADSIDTDIDTTDDTTDDMTEDDFVELVPPYTCDDENEKNKAQIMTPAEKQVPQPAPQPKPVVQSQPAPRPRPQPAPRPQPQPAPRPQPKAVPRPQHNPASPKAVQTPPAKIGIADELRKYKDLLDEGVISQEEFEKVKNQLLNL